jgi:hypothetical protein
MIDIDGDRHFENAKIAHREGIEDRAQINRRVTALTKSNTAKQKGTQ